MPHAEASCKVHFVQGSAVPVFKIGMAAKIEHPFIAVPVGPTKDLRQKPRIGKFGDLNIVQRDEPETQSHKSFGAKLFDRKLGDGFFSSCRRGGRTTFDGGRITDYFTVFTDRVKGDKGHDPAISIPQAELANFWFVAKRQGAREEAGFAFDGHRWEP